MDIAQQFASSLGSAAPFAALAVFIIKWLMARVDQKDAAISALTQQVITLAMNMTATSTEQTAAIKSLGNGH